MLFSDNKVLYFIKKRRKLIIDCRCPGSSSGVFDVLVEDTTYYRMSELSAIIGKEIFKSYLIEKVETKLQL